MADDPKPARTIRFPLSRTTPPRTPGGFRDLGPTPMARALGGGRAAQHGHWCSRCEGIWWGLPLEAQCPVCGRRGA